MGISPHTLNRWVAHGMPIVILGILGFASWVFCALICGMLKICVHPIADSVSFTNNTSLHSIVDYLVLHRKLKGTAVTLLAIYVFLLTLLLFSYVRVVWTINTNPGLVPCGIGGGPAGHEKGGSVPESGMPRNEKENRPGRNDDYEQTTPPEEAVSTFRGRDRWYENTSHNDSTNEIPLHSGERLRAIPYTSTASRSSRTPSPQPDFAQLDPPPQAHIARRSSVASQQPIQIEPLPPLLGPQPPPVNGLVSRPSAFAQWMLPQNLHEFYNMDAFICESDGLPRWCFHCNCWKPDRSHHCGELGRCVRKMDHFCPWSASFSFVNILFI